MRERTSGILLHPTSLPGPGPTGDLGSQARRFVDCLAQAGFSTWQMLPVTVPGAFASPYDCRSAFAGDPRLISLEEMTAEGLLVEGPDSTVGASTPAGDPDAAFELHDKELRGSWENFRPAASQETQEAFELFCQAEEQAFWLDDWALFAALRTTLGEPWTGWPDGIRRRDPEELTRTRRELAAEISYHQFLQFLFFRQFAALRAHADARGVTLYGDLPMYVAHDSADVWAHSDLFDLDSAGRPRSVAGVPPDAFSESGQLWGNPVYNWSRHRELGYRWWSERVRNQRRLTGGLRLDHFRGFVAFWKVPADADDARPGRWIRGPGRRLFTALEQTLGPGRWIAEDLGVITPAVDRLRDQLDLRGMKVLQFGFDDVDSRHLPDRYRARDVAYSGTHDNDTLIGWLTTLDDATRARVCDYLEADLRTSESELSRRLIRSLLESAAGLVILPLQDILALGSEARMNRPGTIYDNWRWRLPATALAANPLSVLGDLVERTGRSSHAGLGPPRKRSGGES